MQTVSTSQQQNREARSRWWAWSLPLLASLVVLMALAVISGATYSTWRSRQVAQIEANCRDAMRRKNWEELETHAQRWLTLDDDSSLAWLYLGEAAQRRGDLELTAKCLASVPDGDPRCVPALLELVELQLGHWERPLDAIETCERILQQAPAEKIAHQRLVYIYALSLQRTKMLEQIQAAAAADCMTPEMIVYLLNSPALKFSNGVTVNSLWLKSHPETEVFEVARAIQLAQIASNAGSAFLTDSGLAPGDESLIGECRKKYPRNVEVLAFFLEKASSQGDHEEVARILAGAPAEAESDSRFWRAKGWLHQDRQELDLAEEAYVQGLQANPFDWRTRHQYAGSLRLQGKLQEVERETALALEGKQLERQLFEIATVGEIPQHLRPTMLKYCEQMGDTKTVGLITRALGVSSPAKPPQ